MTDFIDDAANRDVAPDAPIAATAPPNPDRRPLRLLLLGDRDHVIATIQNLHRRGFAPAGEWSKPIACPISGELIPRLLPSLPSGSVVSILTRYVSQE